MTCAGGKPLFLCGHSLGGGLASMLSLILPTRCTAPGRPSMHFHCTWFTCSMKLTTGQITPRTMSQVSYRQSHCVPDVGPPQNSSAILPPAY